MLKYVLIVSPAELVDSSTKFFELDEIAVVEDKEELEEEWLFEKVPVMHVIESVVEIISIDSLEVESCFDNGVFCC